MTLLPISLIFFNELINKELSLWCKPMLGSSKIYNTPTNSEEICVPNFILWLSPPERVLLSLFNVKYPKPRVISISSLFINS